MQLPSWTNNYMWIDILQTITLMTIFVPLIVTMHLHQTSRYIYWVVMSFTACSILLQIIICFLPTSYYIPWWYNHFVALSKYVLCIVNIWLLLKIMQIYHISYTQQQNIHFTVSWWYLILGCSVCFQLYLNAPPASHNLGILLSGKKPEYHWKRLNYKYNLGLNETNIRYFTQHYNNDPMLPDVVDVTNIVF